MNTQHDSTTLWGTTYTNTFDDSKRYSVIKSENTI